jgi:hypothetical protein
MNGVYWPAKHGSIRYMQTDMELPTKATIPFSLNSTAA